MPIVTLTSDWSLHDFYAGSLKGAIRVRCPDAEVIDISHCIRSFDVVQCAFVLRHTFAHFPQGTIHLMAVQSEPDSLAPMVVAAHRAHYFVGLNDGRFSLLFDDPPAEAFALPIPAEPHSFAALSLFPRAVAAIIEGRLEAEAKPCVLQVESPGRPVYSASEIVGRVIYIDSYGNAITNIGRALFTKVSQGRTFEIFVRGTFATLNNIVGSYDQAATGNMLALFNSAGCLEIALNKANLAQLESLDIHSEIRVKFYDRKR